MKSLILEMKKKFTEIANYCDICNRPDSECICDESEIEEQNVTGAIAGFNIPAAFAKPGKWKSKSVKYESVNTSPTYKIGEYQKPESEEEEMNDKFPFAENDQQWFHKSYDYPHKNIPGKPKRTTTSVNELLDIKYEELIESYSAFKTSNPTQPPSKRINDTIKEIAKKLNEVEQLVKFSARYKTENGVTSTNYGERTKKSLSVISDKLIKISERVRALGE